MDEFSGNAIGPEIKIDIIGYYRFVGNAGENFLSSREFSSIVKPFEYDEQIMLSGSGVTTVGTQGNDESLSGERYPSHAPDTPPRDLG